MKQAGILKAAVLVGVYALTVVLSGCVVGGPREGYYDRGNARWYHNHAWVACGRGDAHCR